MTIFARTPSSPVDLHRASVRARTLATALAATVAMVALYPLSRWRRFREPVPLADVPERPAMDEAAAYSLSDDEEPVMSIGMAFLPYVVLTAVTLGILLVGMGAVSTTTIAGVLAVRRGLAKPIGSLTQMGTVRLGKRTEGRSPLIKDFVPLARKCG